MNTPLLLSGGVDPVLFLIGTAVCHAEARDLEISDEVQDPLLLPEKDKPRTIAGELPWDRYYGNYLTLRIRIRQKANNTAKYPSVVYFIV